MSFWIDDRGKNVFSGGKENYLLAEQCAQACGEFTADYEEEWMADQEVSCYNCRLRRWSADSFECLKRR